MVKSGVLLAAEGRHPSSKVGRVKLEQKRRASEIVVPLRLRKECASEKEKDDECVDLDTAGSTRK